MPIAAVVESMHHHQVAWTLGSYVVASNAIATLPTPDLNGSKFYSWFYSFSHAIMLQVGRLVQDKYKGAIPDESNQDKPH